MICVYFKILERNDYFQKRLYLKNNNNNNIFPLLSQEMGVTPQNVILTQNVITIAAKCNTNAKCKTLTQNVIKYSTQNERTFQRKM